MKTKWTSKQAEAFFYLTQTTSRLDIFHHPYMKLEKKTLEMWDCLYYTTIHIEDA